LEQLPDLIVDLDDSVQGSRRVSKEQSNDVNYYRACAAEMMTKAQAAPSKATKQAYLNLAVKWARQAVEISESEVNDTAGSTIADQRIAPSIPRKN
jgi:hypothetical protein